MKRINVLLMLLFASMNLMAQERAENPIVTHMFTADPTARVWDDGRLYVYPSTDVDPPRGCDLMDGYHVFSTDDMVNWTDHGEILHSRDVEWGREEGGFMWAPDCVYKDSVYYYYFPHPTGTGKAWNDTWKIGVATSKYPEKGFKDKGYMEAVGGFAMIDPNVFIGDDGQAYFYYGGGGKCEAGKLKENMIEIDGKMKDMEGLEQFHEGPFVFKRKGIYYMIYPDGHDAEPIKGNQMRYATSNKPLGPWKNQGIILDPTGCHTTHGSVVEYKGQWYLFYHNYAISGRKNLRSICFDKLFFNEDGTIQKVVQTGSISKGKHIPAVKNPLK
ncbi:MAG: family 43 glycosylhydrolase [Reichenbachiella sp.]